jgi:leucyl-tRNA synthetase
VFLGIEPSEEKKKSRGWNDWVEARREFLYWYPLDSRHSAHDLVHNHLTFFIFNHTAIFEKKYWPRQTVSNGFVTMDGKKMSKSMGNIMPLRKAILQYGADVVRFLVTSSAELDSDSDFNQAAAEGVIMRISLLENYLEKALDNRENSKAANQPASNRSKICRWFYSRFHSRLLEASSLYENFKLRPLAKALFYDTINDLQWYSHRSQDMDLQEFFELWSLAIAPFMPHVAEEFWARLGNKKYAKNSLLAATAPFPQADASQIDAKIEAQEQHIKDLMDDIRRILQIIKIQKPSSIIFIVHSPWKMKVRKLVAEKKNIAKVVEEAKKDSELAPRISQVSLIASKLLKNLGSLNIDVISAQEELELLNESREFLSSQFGGAKIEVIKEEDASPQLAAKASNSMPGKPSIVIS